MKYRFALILKATYWQRKSNSILLEKFEKFRYHGENKMKKKKKSINDEKNDICLLLIFDIYKRITVLKGHLKTPSNILAATLREDDKIDEEEEEEEE